MAAITGAAIAAGAAAYSANRQSSAAKDAARTQQRGADAATAEQRRQFDLSMEMTAPRRAIEGNALNMLAQLTGVPGADGAAPGAPDYSAFYNSPDYQFALEQGEQSAMRGASAMGNLRSGNTLAALTRYGQGMASQQFGNYISRLSSLANGGATQQAANNAIGLGDRVAGNIQTGANARASGIAGSANAWGNFGNQMAMMGGYAMQNPGMFGSSPKQSPMLRGANTTYQTPPYVPTGYGGNNLMRVA
jgi:hypothetical protein